MPVMIQIRNVPDDLHRKLKARAAEQGVTLSDLLLREISSFAERPSIAEWLDRVRSRGPIELPESPTAILRQERDSR